MCSAPLVVFSDVEGLLPDPARSTALDVHPLRDGASRGLPLVICSTRTRAEIEDVHRQLGVSHPFVAENGAALFVPIGYFGAPPAGARRIARYDVVEFGPPYDHVADAVVRCAAACSVAVVGFRQMTAAEIAGAFGVTESAARRAKRREYGEPFRIVNGDTRARRRLARALEDEGLALTAGDRFDLAGPLGDEGLAIALARDLYFRAVGQIITVGFGDRLRDAALLQHVDLPMTAPRLAPPTRFARLAKACRSAAETVRVRQALDDRLRASQPAPPLAM